MSGFILTHDRADLDALASLVAAARLYPGVPAILPRKSSALVRQVWSLYQDDLPVKMSALPDTSPEFVVLVDTHALESTGAPKAWAGKSPRIVVYDHHPLNSGRGIDEAHIEGRGATVGILVDRLMEAAVPISPFEASLYLLGLYADTGCLSYSSTTPADCRLAAHLLERGADLSFVQSFLRFTLAEDQRRLLDRLIAGSVDYVVKGHAITIASLSVDEPPPDLSTLAGRLDDSLGTGTLLAVIEAPHDCFIVGRTRIPGIRLDLVMKPVNGGGHPGAAAAHMKGVDAQRAIRLLLRSLSDNLDPPASAWDLMSRPVHGIFPETTVREALEVMNRFGHSGLLVWDSSKPGHAVGIITRKDIDKALRLDLGRVSVKGFMSANLQTVGPSQFADEIQKLFYERGIGRVPVVADTGEIIGIVTRKDIIRSMGSMKKTGSRCTLPFLDALGKVGESDRRLLTHLGEIAARLRMRVFLVGGPVRDILLGEKTVDWDILVEGDGIEFAEAAGRELKADLQTFLRFQTAKLRFQGGGHLDIVTAREESYDRPAALPKVEPGSLRSDLLRRDFTINALAVSLNPDNFGSLVDFFNGYADLTRKQIRVLHNLSFIEDPTRIFRAVRYEQRFDLHLEEKTLGLLLQALKLGVFKNLTGDRLRNEILRVFAEPHPDRCIVRLDELGIWRAYDANFKLKSEWFTPDGDLLAADSALGDSSEIDAGVTRLLLLLACFSSARRRWMIDHLHLDRHTLKCVTLVRRDADLLKKVGRAKRPSDFYRALNGLPGEYLRYLWVAHPEIRIPLVNHWTQWRHVALSITGDDLKSIGIQAGPEMGRTMRYLLFLKLDGQLTSGDEIRKAREFHGKK